MTTVRTIGGSAPPRVAGPGRGTLLVLLAGIFITALDFFVVNVAIPAVQTDLGATSGQIQFVVAGYGVALAAGLITAGRLGDLYGRRRMFAIGLAVFTLASALTRRLVPADRPAGGARLDLGGAALVSLGLVAIVFPLVQGRELGWPWWTWPCLAGAAVLLAAFVLLQRRAAAPLVDLALFRRRSFAAGTAVALLHMMTMASFFLFLAVYLQDGRGLGALESGLVFLPMGLGYFASSTRAARVAERLGRQTVALGALIMAVGYGLLVVTADAPVGWIIPGLVVAGVGMGFAVASLPALTLTGVDPGHAAAASGVLSTAQQAGGAIGVALAGVVFYGALGTIPHAFAAVLVFLLVLEVAVAALVQALPKC